MKRKVFTGIVDRNLSFIITTFFALLSSISQLTSALLTIENGGQLNGFKYSIIMLKLDVTNGNYHHIFEVGNYALIPILVGLIYNIYIRIRMFIVNENSTY